MARIDSLSLLRARARTWLRAPWMIVLLFAGDLVELAASLVLAFLSPPPAVPAHAAYPVADVPYVVAPLSLHAAIVGILFGLLMGAMLVGELYVLYRRSQLARYRSQRRRPSLAMHGQIAR